MRTLCTFERCCELLLDHQLLADLIVVALLLTSSADIQYICNEAFCNLFSHEKQHRRLLSSDICWAMMNLCRKDGDVSAVRKSCGRIFRGLSCNANYLELMRKNQMLIFAREISSNAENSTEVAYDFVVTTANLATQMSRSMTSGEMRFILGIGLDAMTLHTNSDLCVHVIRMVLKCTELNVSYTLQEFIAGKYDDLLFNCSDIWSRVPQAVLDLTRLLVLMSSVRGFVQAVPWSTLNRLFEVVLHNDPQSCAETMENMTICMFNYVAFTSSPLEILETLCAGSMVLYGFITYKSRNVKFNHTLASLVMYVVASEIKSISGQIADLISTVVIESILSSFTQETDSSTLNNVFIMIEACVRDPTSSASIIEAGLMKFMYLQVLQSQSSKLYMEKCAIVFYTICSLIQLRLLIVNAPYVDLFVRFLIESGEDQVITLVSGALYHLANGYLSESALLTPKFVQDLANEVLGNTKDETLIRIAKQVIAVVLDKYSGKEGIHPSYVISMYQDIQSPKGTDISDITSQLRMKSMILKIDIPKNIVNNPALLIYSHDNQRHGFNPFRNEKVEWQVSFNKERKLMDLSILELVSVSTTEFITTPKRYLVTEIMDPPPLHVYRKIIKVYPRVFIERDDGTTLNFYTLDEEVLQQRRLSQSTKDSNAEADVLNPTPAIKSRGNKFRRLSYLSGTPMDQGKVQGVVGSEEDLGSMRDGLRAAEGSESGVFSQAIEYRESPPPTDLGSAVDANEALEEQLEDLQDELDARAAAEIAEGDERSVALSDLSQGYGLYADDDFEDAEGDDEDSEDNNDDDDDD